MPVSIFGPIINAAQVEGWAKTLIEDFAPTYLGEIERLTGRDPEDLPAPRSYMTLNEFDHMPEDQLPAVVIISPGTDGTPVKEGNHHYRATWLLGIGVIVSARDQKDTTELVKLYTAVIRAIVLQHESLGGHARGVEWRGESYDDLPGEQDRTLAAGQVIFAVEVRDVTSQSDGPATPSDDPYEDPGSWPTVEEGKVNIEYELEELTP